MHQTILRLVCDECGVIEQFEVSNSDPLTATIYPRSMVEKRGWQMRPKQGASQFNTYDVCPVCVKPNAPAAAPR